MNFKEIIILAIGLAIPFFFGGIGILNNLSLLEISNVKEFSKELENNYIKGKRDFSSDFLFYSSVNNVLGNYNNKELRKDLYKIMKKDTKNVEIILKRMCVPNEKEKERVEKEFKRIDNLNFIKTSLIYMSEVNKDFIKNNDYKKCLEEKLEEKDKIEENKNSFLIEIFLLFLIFLIFLQ